jgi:type IV pilus assembly protein PilM
MNFLSLFPKNSVGIDIGTSEIKVVQFSSFGKRIKLENYGQISSKELYHKPFRTFDKSNFLLSTQEIIKAIMAIFEEAKIKTKKAYFSIPDFISFFTTFELPPMTKEEIPLAVEAETRRHVPLPLSEIVWDWQLLEEKPVFGKKKFKILLVSVPKEVVNQYQAIASSLGIKSFSFEIETFSLARALCGKEEGPISIIDFGSRSTSCSIIEKRILKLSRSFDLSDEDFSERIAKSLEIEKNLAEEMKIKYGLIGDESLVGKETRNILISLVNSLLRDIDRTLKIFESQERKEVKKLILAGGGANLPGLLQYFQNYFKKEVEIANPFKDVYFPPILEETLKEMGPSFSVAVGLALKEFE